MTRKITQDWKDWIQLNIDRGCDLDGIYKILSDEGFDSRDIENEMNFVPLVDPSEIINPLKHIDKDNPKITIYSEPAQKVEQEKIFLPNADQLDTRKAEFYTLENFLNADECDRVTQLIKSKLRPSAIASSGTYDPTFRTSRTCDLGVLSDPLIADVDRRICQMMGIDSSFSEIIQGQYYEKGQEFKAHTDYFEGEQIEQYAKEQGQRTYTFMVYLNEVKQGGETEFVRLKKAIQPKKGMAIIWNNLNADGSCNVNTMHHAHPVGRGWKSIITKWFRTKGNGTMFTKEPNEYIKNYTEIGFKKDKLDEGLFKKLLAFHSAHQNAKQSEHVEGGYIEVPGTTQPGSDLIELPEDLRDAIHASLKKPLEEWSQIKLLPTFVYGIRVYRKGSVLNSHRDQLKTHIISAIINIDQDAEETWPLVIEDNFYRKHNIFLEPGEIVFYESGRLLHGRPIPLKGTKFANIFCHFMPVVSDQHS